MCFQVSTNPICEPTHTHTHESTPHTKACTKAHYTHENTPSLLPFSLLPYSTKITIEHS